ncbi:MAG: DNA translocase FtsK [Melioribacteraceae bacterium]|nr:DNA translocase FtsK [Melioribacteraceae bacterium]
MPVRRRKKVNNNDSPYIIPIEKKKKILGFVMIVFALLIFLSILSYSRFDEANLGSFTDLFKVFSNDPQIVYKMESINNWLGLFGAYTSYFFIHATLGYFSIVFPVILFVWGFSIIRTRNFKLASYISNFLLVIAVILSSFFGMLRFELNMLTDVHELSGNIGAFFGTAVGRFLGGLGSIIFLAALAFISVFIVFDIKLGKIFSLLKKVIPEKEKKDKENDIKIIRNDESFDDEDNLNKIKKLRRRKKSEEFGEDDDQIITAEDLKKEEETRIRIVRKDEPEKIIEVFGVDEEPQINTDTEKKSKKDDIVPAVNVDEEKKLPDQWEENINYAFPKIDLLNKPRDDDYKIPEHELTRNAELLKEKLLLFDITIEDISVTPGPVVTLYEIVPAPGVKISRIVSLENDIALALAARGIRIIAPIPGKSAIGVEIPNDQPSLVNAYMVLTKIKQSKAELPLALGKTISGDVYIADLATMPHLLIAGSTGSGKSVGINMIITSLLYSKHPSEVKFVIVDPKKIELSFYQKLNKHYLAVSPDLDEEIITNPQNALLVLKAVEAEMEKRYDKLAKLGVRNIVDYNAKISDPKRKPKDSTEMIHHKLPYIIVIIDELADLMITSGKEVEEPIARIAQLARAVGIHLIVATQRPSVNVITGTIKANFSARIAYQAATKIDSRTILDMKGAEQLLGRGDMLFLPGGMPKPIRIQNAFISTDEVEKITNYIYTQPGYSKRFLLPSMFDKKKQNTASFLADLDDMFEEAARLIVRHQQGSVSLLQRRLKLGYARAARIVDQLEQAGIVGPSEGSKARDVLVEDENQLEAVLRSLI